MAALNADSTVREAVESVLNQTIADLQLVVVDDGSRHPVASTLADVSDDRLTIIRHTTNRGLSAARNAALAAAEAPLVSQLDADDSWEPDYLASVLECFDDPAVGLAYTDATVLGDGSSPKRYVERAGHPIDRFPELAERNPIAASTATMRTAAVRGVGGYAPWLWGGQDYHLYLKLAAAGWRFAYVNRPLARYRAPSPGSSMTADSVRVDRNDVKLWIGFLARHPRTPVARWKLLRLLARKSLRSLPGVQRLRTHRRSRKLRP
jgi:glycosyltransferase involved in cell wall biosynthesis